MGDSNSDGMLQYNEVSPCHCLSGLQLLPESAGAYLVSGRGGKRLHIARASHTRGWFGRVGCGARVTGGCPVYHRVRQGSNPSPRGCTGEAVRDATDVLAS